MRLARTLRSSSFRVALLYMALMGTSMVALLGFIHWSTAGYMGRQLDQTIEAEVEGLAEQYRTGGLVSLATALALRVDRSANGAGVYLLAGDDLTPVVGNLDRWPPAAPDAEGWVRFDLRGRGNQGDETHAARAKTFVLRGDLRLLVGRDVRDLEATLGLIGSALGWGSGLAAALALAGGWLMSAGVVRRIEAIARTSREIMDGDLSRRVPTDGSGDDFDQLADGLNRMLDRIVELMTRVRQVSDSIAHDLRTPLTRLRTKLEGLERTGDPGARAAIESAVADADELLATFHALLRISRIEAGGQPADLAPVDLALLVRDVAELYEPLAGDRGQSLAVSAEHPVWVQGDRDQLFQALANLVDNAVKYTPPGGTIGVSADRDGQVGRIAVSDAGPGIPAELRQRVFERFYRGDASRSTPGSGLGLSLVQAVAQFHGARIDMTDNRPGLCTALCIPLHAPGEGAGRGAPRGTDAQKGDPASPC
jgi:signal transduction histidine kinase